MALIDKASLLMVPSTYEAGKLYNVLPSGNRAPDSTDQNSGYDQTRADFDFDRGSNTAATRIGSDGLIKKYRENLLLQSNQFDTTWLNQLGGTITSGQSGYDGSSNAWLISKSASNFKSVRQVISFSGVTTFSVYAKAGTLTKAALRMDTSAGAVQIIYDLSAGVVSSSAGVFISRGIENIGNGWYRIFVSVNVGSGTNVHIYVDRDGTTAGSIYIQNAQVESGLVSSDYLNSTSVTGKAGVLIDLPRIDYLSGAGALLLEPSRQQLFQYSEYATGWSTSNTGVTIEENATTSPEGVNNAAKIKEDGTNAAHAIRQLTGPTLTSGTDYTFSFFAKKGERSIVALSNTIGASNDANCFFDLENGQVLTNQFNSASIEDFGNGWYRCIATDTADAADDYDTRIYTATADNQFSHQGVSGSGLYIYGLQLEAGSYVSSYIPNHGTSGGVTRAADSCKIAHGEGLPTDYPFVMYSEAEIDTTKGSRCILSFLNEAVGNNYFSLEFGVISGKFTAVNRSQAVIYRVDSSNTYSDGKHKIAILFSSSTHFKMYVDGAEAGEETHAASAFSSDIKDVLAGQLRVVSDTGTRHPLIQIGFFNEALSDSELATLTTL